MFYYLSRLVDKKAYIAFCKDNSDVPLFMRPYWMDAVAEDAWDAILVRDDDGLVRAAWALHIIRRKGRQAIVLPNITPFTGIYLKLDESLPMQKQALQRQQLLEALIRRLPKSSIFEQKVQHTLQDWSPFHWAGFRQETRYTFRFDQVDTEAILANVSKSFRRNLRSAARKYSVEESTDPKELYNLVEKVYQIREDKIAFDEATVVRAFNALHPRGQCAIYRATEGNEVSAVIFAVWDEGTTYYLLGGRNDSNTRSSTTLLIWHAIEQAAARGHAFDFEGSMIKGVHRYFQKFGAAMTPYMYIYKYKDIARLKMLG